MIISRANPIPIRDLNPDTVSQLVRVSGIVISANMLQSKATTLHLMCRSCRHIKIMQVASGIQGVSIPTKCESIPEPGGVKQRCPMDPYIVVHQKSFFVDQQILKIQEPQGMVPVGELPRFILMSTER
jgi:DNA replication licensing factor MCM5